MTPPPEKSAASTRGRRVLVWVAAGLTTLAALIGVLLLLADTGAGHRAVRQLLGEFTPPNGLQVRVGEIEGSLYGRMTLHDLELRDPQGVFLTSPEVTIDWRPASFLLRNRLVLKEVTSPEVRVLRRPQLKPTPKRDKKLLPTFDISLGRLEIERLLLEPAVSGRRQLATVSGALDLRAGRLRTDLQARARPLDGGGGGDFVSVRLDAVPDANRLQIDARMIAPADGAIAGLANLDRPLDARVTGQGSWASWRGQAVVRLGEETLTQLDLSARDGRFGVRGVVRPAGLLSGAPQRLLQPEVSVNLQAQLQSGRRVDATLRLESAAMVVTAEGRLDLRRSRFGAMRVHANLLQPQVLSAQLNGRDVRIAARLDGPFSRPDVEYELGAARLGFGETQLQNLAARGRFRVDAERTVVPVHATIERVTGLDEAVAGVARRMRIDGDVVVTPRQFATDNLRLRSEGLDATLVASGSFATGEYVAALKGTVNRFEQPGVGVFDIVTDARLETTRDGDLTVRGRLEARSRRIDNGTLDDLLGGPVTASATFERTAAGALILSGVDVNAPSLRVVDGRGTIGPGGKLDVAATAQSKRYGRIELTATGSLRQPVLRIAAADPRLGLPITNLEVVLRGGANGYALNATGTSPYGPFAADATLRLGDGVAGLEIREASLGGIRLSGNLRQTTAGPFAGLLTLSGSGLNGTLRLGAEGSVQRVDVQIQARNARLPLAQPVLLAAGAAQATAVLYPGRPSVNAQARLRGVRRGEVTVEQATVRLAYAGQRGTLDLTAQGAGGAPFSIQARAALSPEAVVVNAKGSVAGSSLRLENPAHLRRTDAGWRLRPTTLLLEQGRVDVSGQLGGTTQVTARLRSVDLGLSRAFAPELGLDGEASGLVEATLPPGDVPQFKADLQVKGLSRSGLVSSGVPVDVALVAQVSSAGGEANGLIRRRGNVIGRLKARLGAVPVGPAPWTQRLADAPLSGGLRYNGPADVPWSMTGVTGQSLTGPIALGVDFGGRLSDPQLTGIVRAKALRYENQEFGTVISDLAIEGRVTGSRVDLTRLSGRAGAGTISGRGVIDLSADRGFPMDLRLTLSRARLADSDSLGAVLTGNIAVTHEQGSPGLISGRAEVEEARYRIARRGAVEVPELTGVRRRGEQAPAGKASARAPKEGGFPGVWRLDIAVEGDNRIFVSGMGLESEWQTALRIRGTASQPRIVGEARAVRGGYSFAGRRFDLARGVIRFNGGSAIDPSVDILATTSVEGVAASINVTGRAANPQISFSSTPALPQDEVLARLLFGNSAAELSAGQALQLAASLNALRSNGGSNPLMSLQQASGVDRLRFLGADEGAGRGAALAAGKYISNDVFVEVTTDARGFTAVQIEVALSKSLSILSQVGSSGATNLNLRYRRDY